MFKLEMASLYQKLHENEIRVLEMPANGKTKPVCYKLKHITLGSATQYQTLIYHPTESSKVEISIDEDRLEVTQSCKLALEELEKKSTGGHAAQMVWVAEVCINHEDPVDRQHHASLVHRISKEAQHHNIWHSIETENCITEVESPSSLVQINEDDLASPSNWSKFFQSSDNSREWHTISSFFADSTTGLEPQNGKVSPLHAGDPYELKSLGSAIASLFRKPTGQVAALKLPAERARGLFVGMIDHAGHGPVDSRMILQKHLILAAILGLGSLLAEGSRNLGSLEATVPKDQGQDTAPLPCLDTSYQHFIIPPADLIRSPLTLIAAPLQNHRGFQMHLQHLLIKLEISQEEMKPTREDEDTEKASEENNSPGDDNDPLPESVALPDATDEELAFLEGVDLDQIQDNSPSRLDWMRMKRENGEENIFLDRLMAMTDLEDVKRHFLKTKCTLDTLRRQGVDTASECFNAVFVGRQKVCEAVARLYAHFLISIHAVPGDELIETTAGQYLEESTYSYGTRRRPDQSGVFLMTNPDRLADASDGDDYTQKLRNEMEKSRGKFIFLYTCFMEGRMDSFLEFEDVGKEIPHRVKLDSGLGRDNAIDMLSELLEKRFPKRMQIEGGIEGEFSRLLIHRAYRGDWKRGFASLEIIFSEVCRRQLDRISQARRNGERPDDFLITKEDVLGTESPDPLHEIPAWKEMMELAGMESVKESIRSLASLVRMNRQRELQDQPPLRVGLNRVFLGPPGTGKTTVAKLYGRILADLGLLSSGEIVVKNAVDFIGQYIGWSEEAVKSALESALGKVLVIDEAHVLYPGKRSHRGNAGGDVFRIAVIDTLVSQIQNLPSEDRCVVLIGYSEPMREMFQYSNPGLARRFPLDDAFRFDDFSMEQLTRVLELKLDKQKLAITEQAKDVALQRLAAARDRPNFGNGGEVDNLLHHALTSSQRRISANPSFDLSTPLALQPEDFDADFDRLSDSESRFKESFKDIVGCKEVIAKFDGYRKSVQGMRMCGRNPRSHNLIPLNFVFKGPPGTGKTTMARKVGKLFYDMGFLSSSDVVECFFSEIIGEALGQTGPKVVAALERALGKVLFIDEAYRLAQGDFATDAINELVDCMTKERFANKMVIILAGYAEGMDSLREINQGFASRFATEVLKFE
ncbi:hypothetical protein AYO21_11493 [Fonsecaea monophora]|uniref:AAA+ ATPase domain-containing protein n=1 Tax=Fonsecaea monophora TaxID=254056 RepID=A0A177ESA4_9EURO|nr:hypothetical protein AYO21_11493 [Fonsecaea monophora]OAG34341.1 hypothetical protein AYO21_11493 [Fonsecaea monophora]